MRAVLRKFWKFWAFIRPVEVRPITPDIICPDCRGISDGSIQFHWDDCKVSLREWTEQWNKIMAEPNVWD